MGTRFQKHVPDETFASTLVVHQGYEPCARGRGVATAGGQSGLRQPGHSGLDNMDDLDWGSDDGLPRVAGADPLNRSQEGLRDQADGREAVDVPSQEEISPEAVREQAVRERPILRTRSEVHVERRTSYLRPDESETPRG